MLLKQETGLKKQLVRKEAELTKAEEGHRQQMEEMKQRVSLRLCEL